MRKVVAFVALALLSGECLAQDSVTLYGRVDTGIEYVNGLSSGGSRVKMEAGDWGANFFGFQGQESLGGGLKAIFKLESGFSLINGQNYSGGANLFQRWAYVGLSHDLYGTIKLGQQFWISNGDWDFDPFGQTIWASQSLVRGRDWPNASNDISYQSPKIAGFDFVGQYALSNSTSWNGNGTTAQGREVGAQITYTSAYAQFRGIYDEIRDPANGRFTDVYAYSREYFLGANVFVGPAKLSLAYTLNSAPDAAPGTSTRTQMEWAGLTYQVNQPLAIISAVYHVNANGGGGSATLGTIGATYNLSKRTLVDIQVAHVCNSKSANFSLYANSTTSGDNPLPGNTQTGVYAGIQHSF